MSYADDPTLFASVHREAHTLMRAMMPRSWVDAYRKALGGAQQDSGPPGEPTPFVARPIDFQGEPDCFFEHEGGVVYRGQDHVKRRLDIHIRSLQAGQRRKGLFTGPAGTGKTTLMRIVARRIQLRHRDLGLPEGGYFELLPAQVKEKANLDAFMLALVQDPYAIVGVDEVHTLVLLEEWFHTLHDSGELKYPMSDGSWLVVPKTISWFFATTNPGDVDPTNGGAMMQRMGPEFPLYPLSVAELADVLADDMAKEGMEIEPAAAREIARRGVIPRAAKDVLKEARQVADIHGGHLITLEDADEAFSLIGLDENGLLPRDRAVLKALLSTRPQTVGREKEVVYRLSETNLRAAANVDEKTYKTYIQPKLSRLGLLIVRGGQMLTQEAIDKYGWLTAA